MSHNIRLNVATAFDGATYFDLSNPDFVGPFGEYNWNVTLGNVGLIDLETVPNIPPSVGIWVQVVTISKFANPAALYNMAVFNPITGGIEPLFSPVLVPSPLSRAWNILLPQKMQLRIQADDGAAGPEGGELDISFWPYQTIEWPYLQCCHKFGPYEFQEVS